MNLNVCLGKFCFGIHDNLGHLHQVRAWVFCDPVKLSPALNKVSAVIKQLCQEFAEDFAALVLMSADGTQHAREVLEVIQLESDKHNYNILHTAIVYGETEA